MLHYTVNQHPHWARRQYGHSGGTREWLDERDVNFACRIHPAVQSNMGEQQWVTGFSLCVKCCRMVVSLPRC